VVVGNGVAGEETVMVAIDSHHLRGEGLGAPMGVTGRMAVFSV
jgi:hypothetical protein